MTTFYESVYKLVRDIPRGRVMTYGQIAVILGHPRAARAVGYALRASTHSDVPWQRVINRRGQISARSEVGRPLEQRVRLEEEGVVFNADEACDLPHYRWEPPQPEKYLYLGRSELPF
jgi:methylated-DNA-protein-cysteine methyltransferase related protein